MNSKSLLIEVPHRIALKIFTNISIRTDTHNKPLVQLANHLKYHLKQDVKSVKMPISMLARLIDNLDWLRETDSYNQTGADLASNYNEILDYLSVNVE